jgi:multidrug resistance efflux pump
VQAVRFQSAQVPQVAGQGGRQTLTKLISNGSRINAGDVLAEFDRTQQLDKARDAQAKYDDLGHQVEQKSAQNRSDAVERDADLQEAEADLAKAEIQLRKGPLLAEIERLKTEVQLEAARRHVASLKKSNVLHDTTDAAALRILALQHDREKVNLDRALNNAAKLEVRSPISGMVAYENVWRNGSMGHPQEGDQLWGGQPLIRIFDPAEMEVRAMVGEPDVGALSPGSTVRVRLDAYPDLVFAARFDSASPAAASALGSPIKTFAARFVLENRDPHLLPDLSAAVVIDRRDDSGHGKHAAPAAASGAR